MQKQSLLGELESAETIDWRIRYKELTLSANVKPQNDINDIN